MLRFRALKSSTLFVDENSAVPRRVARGPRAMAFGGCVQRKYPTFRRTRQQNAWNRLATQSWRSVPAPEAMVCSVAVALPVTLPRMASSRPLTRSRRSRERLRCSSICGVTPPSSNGRARSFGTSPATV